jgi:RNA polymerase sigma-70 factor (ECF subfamily)
VHTSDPLLADLLALGDHAALAELYDRYGGTAYGLAHRVTRDEQIATAAVCSAFATAWREAAQAAARDSTLYAWLIAITHRAAVAAVRASREPAGEWPCQLATDRGGAAGAGLVALSEREREVIDRCYFDGYRELELAHRLDLAPSTVQSRTRSALDALRARTMHGWMHPESPASRSPRSRGSASGTPTPST